MVYYFVLICCIKWGAYVRAHYDIRNNLSVYKKYVDVANVCETLQQQFEMCEGVLSTYIIS